MDELLMINVSIITRCKICLQVIQGFLKLHIPMTTLMDITEIKMTESITEARPLTPSCIQ